MHCWSEITAPSCAFDITGKKKSVKARDGVYELKNIFFIHSLILFSQMPPTIPFTAVLHYLPHFLCPS